MRGKVEFQHAPLTIDNFFQLPGNLSIHFSFCLPLCFSPFLHTFRNCKLCKSQWTAFNYKSTQLAGSTLQKYLQNAEKL